MIRKYKAGYIWQDLMMDDDLITPISDNEYVLKGCDVRRATESPKEKSSSLGAVIFFSGLLFLVRR